LPKLSYLVRDDLLQSVLGYFTARTGVRVWFQDGSGYTIAPETNVPELCGLLVNHQRCGLANPEVGMPPDGTVPSFRLCLGGIGHLIIPIELPEAGGAGRTEVGRLISEPMAIRETTFEETMAEAARLHIHPDNLALAARQIPVVEAAEVSALTGLVAAVVARIARDTDEMARSLALAERLQEVGRRGSTEILLEMLAGLVQDFAEADATIVLAGPTLEGAGRRAVFRADLPEDRRELITTFAGEAMRWIDQTGYPISFPDLGGSAWCRHVLGGQNLEGSLVAMPVKPSDPEVMWWWAAYFRHPSPDMEDRLHRLSVLAAHSLSTVNFLSRLEASQEAAMTDPITGLYNRRFLHEQLERELARATRARYPVSLLIFDIDNFKLINDTHGHPVGDEAVKHVARVLAGPLRRSSTICRYGGDEFCIIVPECDQKEAVRVAERLRQCVEETPLELPGQAPVRLQVSGGVATQQAETPAAVDLVELADRELIRAKREGKGRIVWS
jgi:diguanylate cyclase (GGDEF)-like protein